VAGNDVFLWSVPSDANSADVRLRDPTAGSSGTPTAYTLAGDAGSYTVAGNAATFRVSRALAGAAGAYTVDGTDGVFTYTPGSSPTAYSLAGDAGAYVVTGFAGTFNHTTTAETVQPAGRRSGDKTLAEYEFEWARLREETPPAESTARVKPARVRRSIKREAAQQLYFPADQQHATELVARRDEAIVAEMRARLDLADTQSPAHAELARIAIGIAMRKKAAADAAIEEFDIVCIAAMMEHA
jgi:hypothetical protein